MAKQLKVSVLLRESTSTLPVTFGPGDKLPDWASKRIAGKEHLFEEVDPDESYEAVQLPASGAPSDPELVQTGELSVREPAATELGQTEIVQHDEESDDDDDAGDEIPRGNASGLAWAEFASAHGVPVTEDMGRDDIKKACKEAGLIP